MSSIATVYAEVVLDGTLGFKGALKGPDYKIGAELGQQHGGNLFQSFRDFNLNTGESATFSGPNSVQNIFSRVTGGNPSRINGLIRSTIPNADMYFLNPYGIMFGEGASLDVQGSFHASTADTLRFSDGGEFNARYPNNSLLTVAPVAAFGFLTDSPTAITVQNIELSVSKGKTLSLIGGDLQMDGELPIYSETDSTATFNSVLFAEFGRINLASVASHGEVVLTESELTLNAKERGQITANNTNINTNGDGGGAIYIHAGRFKLHNGVVGANTFGNQDAIGIDFQGEELKLTHGGQLSSSTFSSGLGGNIKINAVGTVEISGEGRPGFENSRYFPSGIFTNSESQIANAGNAGSIELSARQLYINGAQITTGSFGTGNGGSMSINVLDDIILSGESSAGYPSGILSNSYQEIDNAGSAGNIMLEAGQLSLENGAVIQAANWGGGQGGDIKIQVIDFVNLFGNNSRGSGSLINAAAEGEFENAGNSGSIELATKQLQVADGGQIATTTWGPGQGGNIHIKVIESAIFSDEGDAGYPSGVFTSSMKTTGNAGNAGTILLEANQLKIQNGAMIQSSTRGEGKGGDIKIQVASSINLFGESRTNWPSEITASTVGNTENTGKGGTIELESRQLSLADGAGINTSTSGSGQGGDINLHVTENIFLSGENSGGNRSRVTSSSKSEANYAGNAGNIIINTNNTIQLQQNSIITAQAKRANGGNIYITSPGYLYLTHSGITTSVFAEKGDGGNITLAPEFIVLDDSEIIARAYEGRGGNIDITTTGIYNNTTQGIFESPLRRAINASSELGIDGEVQINTPEIDITAGLFALPTQFSTPQLDKGCTPSKLYNELILKEGFRKAAVSKLLETTWASLYLSDNNSSTQETEDTLASIDPFEPISLSLTKPLFGCHLWTSKNYPK